MRKLDEIAPLRLAAVYKDYLWGGTRLKTEFGKDTPMNPLAESWELSCHADGLTRIAEGTLAGQTLKEVLLNHPQWLHAGAAAGEEFPLMVKLIDAAGPLSVQVHPDEAYAKAHENDHGKTEMWFVVDALPGAGIYYGCKEKLTRQQAEQAVAEHTLTDHLRWVQAKPGDFFFIPAGTIHAIGAGMLVAEVQQSANVTYRLYDYGRVGTDGRTRPLHVQKALDVAQLAPAADRDCEPVHTVCGGQVRPLVSCPAFDVRVLCVMGEMPHAVNAESFEHLLCLQGEGVLTFGEERLSMKRGYGFFLPAGMGGCTLSGSMQLLCTRMGKPQEA